MRSLEVLKLKNNKIKYIGPEILSLGRLKDLDLSTNNITRLPDELGLLTQLVKLNLSALQVKCVPDSRKSSFIKVMNKDFIVGNLKLLEELELQDNRSITYLPDTCIYLSALKKLNLRNTQIMHLNEDLIANLSNLVDFCIRDNPQIGHLPSTVLNLLSTLILCR